MEITRTELRLFKNILLHPTRLINTIGALYCNKFKTEYMPFSPLNIDVEPTVRCNLRCSFCVLPVWDRKVGDLTFEEFKKIMDQLPYLLKMKIQGIGEPTLNKDFFNMIDYAADKDILIKTTTNGTLLTEDMAKKVADSGLHEISISIDGAKKETFESIRKGANFEKVLDGVKRLVKARGKRKYPIISVWMVGTNDNIRELPDLLRICKKLRVDKLTIQTTLNMWGRTDIKDKLKGKFLDDQSRIYLEIIENSKKLAKELKFKLRIFTEDRLSEENKCVWPWLQSFITSDGYIVPCCVRADPDLVNFGNLKEKSFKTIWNSPGYKSLRKSIKQHHTLKSYCVDCYSSNA